MNRYREATLEDVPEMERIRLPDSAAGPADLRMASYLRGEHHPQEALMPRVMYVAADADAMVGYIGGHLTRRYGCDGELQYLYVVPEHRRTGVGSEMLQSLWGWFQERNAPRICVDVVPGNERARGFYMSHGARSLNSHWLVWSDIRKL